MLHSDYIDGSLYPDEPPPDPALRPLTSEEKAEHIHRVCASWEFGLPPEPETLRTVLRWKEILEMFPCPQHLTWHTLRELCGLPPVPGIIFELPYERMDAAEGRTDPCVDLV